MMALFRRRNQQEEDFFKIARAIEQKRLREEGKIEIARFKKSSKQFSRDFSKGSERFGESVGRFGRVGIQKPSDFTKEQRALGQMFGQGEKIWGFNEPVQINNDLNPRQRGDFGTARLFGF